MVLHSSEGNQFHTSEPLSLVVNSGSGLSRWTASSLQRTRVANELALAHTLLHGPNAQRGVPAARDDARAVNGKRGDGSNGALRPKGAEGWQRKNVPSLCKGTSRLLRAAPMLPV